MRSGVPMTLAAIGLKIGTQSTAVTVEAGQDLIESDPTTHTDMDRELFDKLPLESQSSSLSSLVTLASPGIAADSNGLFHGLGDHASNSFSIDGQPITDQQSKVFSNQLPVDAVQSMEVIEGAPPAEYGGKTSVVIVATTRSGLGATEPHGDVTASYGSFGTSNEGFDLAYGGKTWGNFISANGMDTSRFLDGPEFTVMHDHGNEENVFDRLDFKLSSKDTINVNFSVSRGAGSRRRIRTTPRMRRRGVGRCVRCWDIRPRATVWARTACRWARRISARKSERSTSRPPGRALVNANTVFTFGGWARQDQYNYYPSAIPSPDLTPDLQLQSVGPESQTDESGHAGDCVVREGDSQHQDGGPLRGHHSDRERHASASSIRRRTRCA